MKSVLRLSGCGWCSGSSRPGPLITRAVTGVAFHLFTTIAFVALAAPGVTSWRTLGVVALVGLVIDIARHVLSPECRTTPEEMWRQCQGGIADSSNFQKAIRTCKVSIYLYAALWIVCGAVSVTAISLAYPNEAYGVPSYISFSFPVEAVYSSVSSFERRVLVQLTEHGYPNRANIVSFICAINLPFFILGFVITYYGFSFYNTMKYFSYLFTTNAKDVSAFRTFSVAVWLFIGGALSHFVASNFISITFIGYGGGFSTNLVNGSEFLYNFNLLECCSALFLSFSYQVVVNARCLAHVKI
jgi:hypothetical protein